MNESERGFYASFYESLNVRVNVFEAYVFRVEQGCLRGVEHGGILEVDTEHGVVLDRDTEGRV